jgi:prepilin-type N-terminal cleavage/methylation domain-containing protein
MNTTKNQRGFTIIEIIIAIIVLTVGVLGLVTTAALVTRMIARGQRSAAATAFQARRIERIRSMVSGQVFGNCVLPAPGSDTLYRGTTWVAINNWTAAPNAANAQNFRVKVVTTYKTQQNNVRHDSTETTFSCDPFQ